MSSHDCRINATLSLRDDVTEDQVRAALAGFLEANDLDFDDEVKSDAITFDESEGSLLLSIDFSGYGGYQNEGCDALALGLAEIVGEPSYFEMLDEDTGDSDAACVPYFIGRDSVQKARSRVVYGLEQMEQWLSPVLDAEALAAAMNAVRSAPLKVS